MQCFLTIDTDGINQNNINFEINNLCFDYSKELMNFFYLKIPTTVFVRIDEQISREFYPLHVYDIIKESISNIDSSLVELGWHPHFFDFENGKYKSTSNYVKIVEEMIYWKEHIPIPMHSIRMGACQFNNKIMQTICKLGFKYDSSGLSGCKRKDELRHYDWSRIDNRPYHPCEKDYQSKGSLELWELPITTIPIKTIYDNIPKIRAVNPCIKKKLFQKYFKDFNGELEILVIAFHADELITGYKDDLYDYGFENITSNLEFLNKTLDLDWKLIKDFKCPE